jgi:hypothetical protein
LEKPIVAVKGYILSKQFLTVVGLRKRDSVRQSIIYLIFGAASVGVAFVLSRMSAAGLFPVDSVAIVGVSMVLLVICIALATLTLFTDMLGGNKRMGQPNTPDRDVITRVVRNDSSGKEYFIYGAHEDTVRKLLKDDWPFAEELKNSSWHLVDEKYNDVTDKLLSDFEGIAKIVFD